MELFYRRYGEGNPYIILHGMFEMSDNWVSLARILARHYDVIIPDLRNHGQSPHSPVHTNQAMVDDLKELVGNLQLDKFIIQGFSMGGRVAMKFAQQNQDLVKKLIVIDISPRFYGRDEFFKEASCIERFEKMANLDLSIYSTREEIEAALNSILQNPRLTKVIMKNVKREGGIFKWKFNVQAINANYDNLREQVLDENIAINIPTLLIRGEKSKYVQQQDLDYMNRIFTNLEVVTIEGATHFLPIEKPQEMMQAIMNFVQG